MISIEESFDKSLGKLLMVASVVAVVQCRRHVEGWAADEESGGLELKAVIADWHHPATPRNSRRRRRARPDRSASPRGRTS